MKPRVVVVSVELLTDKSVKDIKDNVRITMDGWKGTKVKQVQVNVIKKTNTSIYNMKLHDMIDLTEAFEELSYIPGTFLPFRYITRVPGGWIYSNYDVEKDIYTTHIFVPFNIEFQSK